MNEKNQMTVDEFKEMLKDLPDGEIHLIGFKDEEEDHEVQT